MNNHHPTKKPYCSPMAHVYDVGLAMPLATSQISFFEDKAAEPTSDEYSDAYVKQRNLDYEW